MNANVGFSASFNNPKRIKKTPTIECPPARRNLRENFLPENNEQLAEKKFHTPIRIVPYIGVNAKPFI